jgi:Tfp pilus assembly protein PilF
VTIVRKQRKPASRSTGPRAAPSASSERSPSRRFDQRWVVVGLLFVSAALVAGWWALRGLRASATPVAAVPLQYVDSRECLECHVEQASQWRGSHHARAMAPATVKTVLGRFDGAEFRHRGVTSRFFRRDGKYVVNTDGPDGRLADFEVAYTFGVAPLQQYLITLPGGRLQALQIAWDDVKKRWFHLRPQEKAPPGDVLHWTGRYQTANTMCIACHTTGFEKRYDAASDSFDSRWKEANVSCQACHGPGQRHVQWAHRQAGGRTDADTSGEHMALAVSFKTGSAEQQVDVCAACHSRRGELSSTPQPGQPRLDHYLPSLLAPGLYHADGQQLDEVFVDGSFRQSRMFQMGVRCSDCHDVHSGKLKRAGNALCTECHARAPNPRFPTAAGNYDAPEHHHHPVASPGAQCVACHMPARTYMQIQPRPDHSIRVPRPDLTLKIGTPNACRQCHAGRPAQWAAAQVVAWYGPRRRHDPHYGEALAAGRAGAAGANAALTRLVADAALPSIVRASALATMRGDDALGLEERVAATRDPSAEVRAAAADSLAAAPAVQRVPALGPLLGDPARAVRMAAVRSLSSLPPEQIGPSLRASFDAALAEFIAVQSLALDMPGARLGLAVVYANTGRADLAEQHYAAALKIDPDFTPARENLALLYNALARNADAERVLRRGLQRQPRIGELQYSLGLLLAEENRLTEAAAVLSRAAQLLSGQARVHYNLGLAQLQLGRRQLAVQSLREAHRLDPNDPQPPQALAIYYAKSRQTAAALQWAQRWASLAPSDPQPRRLISMLQSAADGSRR